MSGRVRLKETPAVVEDAPSLLEICFNYLVDRLPIICSGQEDTLELRNGIVLPYNICNRCVPSRSIPLASRKLTAITAFASSQVLLLLPQHTLGRECHY